MTRATSTATLFSKDGINRYSAILRQLAALFKLRLNREGKVNGIVERREIEEWEQ
jgi:hypothetical protein